MQHDSSRLYARCSEIYDDLPFFRKRVAQWQSANRWSPNQLRHTMGLKRGRSLALRRSQPSSDTAASARVKSMRREASNLQPKWPRRSARHRLERSRRVPPSHIVTVAATFLPHSVLLRTCSSGWPLRNRSTVSPEVRRPGASSRGKVSALPICSYATSVRALSMTGRHVRHAKLSTNFPGVTGRVSSGQMTSARARYNAKHGLIVTLRLNTGTRYCAISDGSKLMTSNASHAGC